jgi:hypothetical protein
MNRRGGDKMKNFLEIKCLSQEEQNKIQEDIRERIADKIKEGVFSEREIKEIENMKLRPLPDIQDVQSVFEDFLFRKKGF